MKVYTKTGDRGQTSLATGERVSKTDARLCAYGTADELNSFIGNLRAALPLLGNLDCQPSVADIDALLVFVQNRLFDLGATLAGAPIPLPEDAAARLETAMDAMQDQLPTLHAFILPAGDEVTTRSHICRTITRRLERAVLLIPDCEQQYAPELVYINRLSDYFFVLARYLTHVQGKETQIWIK